MRECRSPTGSRAIPWFIITFFVCLGLYGMSACICFKLVGNTGGHPRDCFVAALLAMTARVSSR